MNASMTTSSSSNTFEKAHSIWVNQHPQLLRITNWVQPNPHDDLLGYCEWRLWDAFRKDDLPRGFSEWFLGFYIKLATSADIKDVCKVRCRSRTHADGLLGLLFRESDRMELDPDCPADRPVFDGLLEDQIKRASHRKRLKEDKRARADDRQFATMRDAIDGLSPEYPADERAELHAMVEKHASKLRGLLMLGPPHPGPSAVVFDGQSPLMLIPPSRDLSVTMPPSSGRPSFNGASEDTYLELVRRFVKKAYRGRDELERAVTIVQHFCPGLLPEGYDAARLGSRLKTFLEKPGVRTYVSTLEHGYGTRLTFMAQHPPSRYLPPS